jgi:flagellin
MDVAMERLATGKRINAARDDAAGIAIRSRLESNVRGLNQAVRNALDGQALLDTAEGGLQEVEAILQRMRELAVQAANDTNSATDRSALNAEIQSLSSEIDRINNTTSWAGQKILDGTFTDKNFNVGAGAGQSDFIKISIPRITAIMPNITGESSMVTEEIINFAATDAAGVTVDLGPGTYTFIPVGITEGGQYDVWSGHPADTTFFYEYTVTSNAIGGSSRINWPATRYADPRDAIDAAPTYGFSLTGAASVNVSRYDNPGDYLDNSGGLSIKLRKVQVVENPIEQIDAALHELNLSRALLGATSNRLNHIVSNNTNAARNAMGSMGRIDDADYAMESVNLARSQILVQSAVAMIAQANASKREILKLIEM